MSLTPSNIKARFPEFNTIDDATIQTLLDETSIFITSKYGKYEDICTYYYVAHTITINRNEATGNYQPSQLTASESVGNVSTSYANPTLENTDDAFYSSTSYGQKYLEFRKKALRQFGASIV